LYASTFEKVHVKSMKFFDPGDIASKGGELDELIIKIRSDVDSKALQRVERLHRKESQLINVLSTSSRRKLETILLSTDN